MCKNYEIKVNGVEFKMFFEGLTERCIEASRRMFPNMEDPKFTFKEGRRYIKIIRDTSAYCFVDKTNGNVLKAASWSAPAKGPRGNILNPDKGLSRCGMYTVDGAYSCGC